MLKESNTDKIRCLVNRLLRRLWSLSAILRASLFSVGYTCCIKSTSDDVIPCTRQILNSSATDENNAVLLKVVTFSGNVACYLDTVRKTYSGDLSKS